MKKTVVKTALITLACIAGAFVLLFFSLFFLSPKTVGKLFDDMGAYSASVYFYQRQYEKTGTTEDLAVLVFKLDEENDSAKTFVFSVEMSKKQDFISYCTAKDQKDISGRTGNFISTEEFVLGKLVVSAFLSDSFSTCILTSGQFVQDKGYTLYNPYRVLISRTANKMLEENLLTIKEKLQTLQAEKTGSELALINSDINYIDGLLNN